MKPYFSSREIRALMIFLPLCVLAVAGMRLARPKAGPAEVCAVAHEAERPADSVRLFRFDPNTIDYAGLRQLGLTAYEAASLLKYRAAGKVFRIPEDVATCYGFTDSLYFRLAPYIRIGRKYAVAPPAYRSERVVRQPLAPRRSSSTRCRRSTCGPSGRCRSARPRPSCAGATCTESATWRSCANAMSCRTRWLRRSNPMSVSPCGTTRPSSAWSSTGRTPRRCAPCTASARRRCGHPALPRAAGRLPLRGAAGGGSGGHGAQLRVDCETNLVRQL